MQNTNNSLEKTLDAISTMTPTQFLIQIAAFNGDNEQIAFNLEWLGQDRLD